MAEDQMSLNERLFLAALREYTWEQASVAAAPDESFISELIENKASRTKFIESIDSPNSLFNPNLIEAPKWDFDDYNGNLQEAVD
ncbi:MAG TPA: hypothetical protein VK171_04530, partial [Fimbriimonas sp.]|nr:hypothetical protein [Fimbriimonas sp.]